MKSNICRYLSERGVYNYESGNEIIAHCVFNDCDKESHGKEAHLYISSETGQYQCKKCLSEGNMLTMCKHFGDNPEAFGFVDVEPKKPSNSPVTKAKKLTEEEAEKYHRKLPVEVRNYLIGRGLTEETINQRKLGWGSFYGENWITIPVRDMAGSLLFLKLRRDPKSTEGNKYMFYPSGNDAAIYGIESLEGGNDYVVICEGEFDQMILTQNCICAITSTGGAGTFKEPWLEHLSGLKEMYVCFDNDIAGTTGSAKLMGRIKARFPDMIVKKVGIPEKMGKDVTDFFQNSGTVDDLMSKYSEEDQGVNVERFNELTSSDIIHTLSLTIKEDNDNKLVVFLAMLSAFTEDSQLNVLLNAPSSSGKSYIPLEIARLFPADSLMKLQYVSLNAFFHENGEYDKETNERHIYLNRKIIIFIDQPRSDLLARLRPLLSHDEKILTSKITDKNTQGGNKTKTIVIHGYPMVVFCTASVSIDEQEATRFLLLSPEITDEKFRQTIHSKVLYESDKEAISSELESNPERALLRERIEFIRDCHITDIQIHNPKKAEELFTHGKQYLKPRHQRDVGRWLSMIKLFALLNLPHRKREGSVIYTTDRDIEEAHKLWSAISPGQEHNISPYAMSLYESVFLPAYREFMSNQTTELDGFFEPKPGVPRNYILKKHMEVYHRAISDAYWRQEIEPMLVSAGLIVQEQAGRNLYLKPMYDTVDTVSTTGV